jgi:UDP-N-acetylglucosamine--N-acetylmuramyl-(pentapeptide) pyrophosphoryl-undecaprenol N-acetylglucosamine transferase
MVAAARLAGLPTAILEQNALPGFTNKMLGKVVDAAFLSLPEAGRFFSSEKVRLLGNPIRRAIREALSQAGSQEQNPRGGFSVLILGGSLGATALNTLLPEALALVGRPLSVVHQTGKKDEESVRAAYAAKGIEATVSAFFDKVAELYQRADLVICRAGATTIAELGVVGRPSILIPFPFAADNHQEVNAQSLVSAGAAKLFRQSEVTPEVLAETVRALVDAPEQRAKMSEAARRVGKPNAARDVASELLELIRNKSF